VSPARVIVVVQARASSARLPGKVLRVLAGRSLLAHLIERLRRAALPDGLMIATSAALDDDAVAAEAARLGVRCHRGSLSDVAGRMLGALRESGSDALVRISGDSPLLDPALVDRAIALFRETDADLVTNVQRRTFPKGQSVEVVTRGALERACAAMTDNSDREHVTPYLYAHPESIRIVNFASEIPRGDLQLSVDTEEDLARVRAILDRLGEPASSHGLAAVIAAADALERRA